MEDELEDREHIIGRDLNKRENTIISTGVEYLATRK